MGLKRLYEITNNERNQNILRNKENKKNFLKNKKFK